MRNPTFLNLVLLAGDAAQKLRAARGAGFEQVEIWREDAGQNTAALAQLAGEIGLGFTNLQVLRDATGVPSAQREAKREEARMFFQLAKQLGCNTVQAPASTDKQCVAEHIDDDLRWLSTEAARHNMRLMYEPMAWSQIDHTLPQAWQRLKRLDLPNVGLVVDLFHICARGGSVSDLAGIPMHRIYEVQLCDVAEPVSPQEMDRLFDTARHRRQLPGEGYLPIAEFVDYLKSAGYAGPVGIEVFNDHLKQLSAEAAAQRAFQALRRAWPED